MGLSYETYEHIKKRTSEFLTDFGFTNFPLDPLFILETLGVKTVPYSSFDPETKKLALEASEEAFHTVKKYSDLKTIIVAYNDEKQSSRIKFSLGHELAHMILEHSNENSEQEEAEANYCTGYLLVPDPLAISWGITRAEDIEKFFEVGRQCSQIAEDHIVKRLQHGGNYKDYEINLINSCSIQTKGGEYYARL